MRVYGISVKQMYSPISEAQLVARITSIVRHNPALGEKSVDGLLCAEGCVVQRQRIRDALWAADPEGIQFRLRCCLQRREYNVEAPNSLWHIDGYHKLICWKIVIHGANDGFSRIILLSIYKWPATTELTQHLLHSDMVCQSIRAAITS